MLNSTDYQLGSTHEPDEPKKRGRRNLTVVGVVPASLVFHDTELLNFFVQKSLYIVS